MGDEPIAELACEIVIQVVGGKPADQRFALLLVNCDGRCEVFEHEPWSEDELTRFLRARYEPGIDIGRRIRLARTQWADSSVVPRPSRPRREAPAGGRPTGRG